MKNNCRGTALVLAMVSTAVIATLASTFVARAVQEKNLFDRAMHSSKSFYAAEAGAQVGLYELGNLINKSLMDTVAGTAPAILAADADNYVTNRQNGVGFLLTYVLDKNRNALLNRIEGQTAVPAVVPAALQAVYTGATTAVGDSAAGYTIRIWEKSSPVRVQGNIWDFPFFFRVESTGTNGGAAHQMSLQGDFTVRVQKDNFARYALFTNAQTMESGTNVWFTGATNFSGPVFTNGTYNFANNPSGTFYSTIRQAAQTARFYNNNNPVLLDANANGNKDVPVFHKDFFRKATAVTMPANTVETDMANQASNSTAYVNSGIYLPSSSGVLKGGVYVVGDAAIDLSVDGQSRQVLTVVTGGSTKKITLDRINNQTIIQDGASSAITVNGLPNGASSIGTLVYVKGNITELSGIVQGATQMTIASKNDVVITDNLFYQDYTAGSGTPGTTDYIPPTAEGANNLLGILSWNGDVRIDANAPSNISIDATLMAKSGVVQVDNYDSGRAKGVATILGGVISNNYGAFGTFNSTTGAAVSGYGRNFVYDRRLETALNPPYFPTLNTFIAFTDDIRDKITWQSGGF